MAKRTSSDDDLLHEGKKAYQRCVDAEHDNRIVSEEDIKFARLNQHWPDKIRKQREQDGRPCLTIPKLPAFIRQVVNDARQNKPSIKVRPVDSGADPKVADIMSGLIRNIEYSSNADVAYDTAVECAVSGGIGYIRVGLDYAYDDSFEADIRIERVANPFAVYGDPNSQLADSSDWDVSFVTDRITKGEYERKYGDGVPVDWDSDDWRGDDLDWLNDDGVLVAEWWTREEVDRPIVLLDDGKVVDREELQASHELMLLIEQGMLHVKAERLAKSCEVTQRIMSGAAVLKETKWLGRYIPIVPVYGDEFNVLGKRYWRSLIHNAKDAQLLHNVWRSTSTELVALAPRVPFIGPKGAFDSDIERWQTANTRSHPYLEYDPVDKAGGKPPQRQPLDSGPAAGALQEALNASDDIKAILGMYDASLGARSNETSGKAILARQREGDVSTFHFIDNMARAIRHTGRILIDLIPKVYSAPRIVRVIGEDGRQASVQVNTKDAQAVDLKSGQPMLDEQGKAITALYDLTTGKYDLTVSTGPSFTTRREEAAAQMTEMIRAMPETAPVLGKHLARNLDWPGADEIADELDELSANKVPPEVEQKIAEGQKQIAALTQEVQQLKADMTVDAFKARSQAELQQQKFVQDATLERERFEFEKQMAAMKATHDRDLSMAKIKNERDAKAMQADGVETKGPDGETVVKSGTEVVMEALAMLGQLIVRQGETTNAQLERIAEITAAPNELVRDPKTGRAAGSRKVMPALQ